MIDRQTLLARVKGEYTEMPGLRLTLPQACRLWQLDPGVCEVILQMLVSEGFLIQASDGTFIARPTTTRALKRRLLPHYRRSA